MFTLKVLSLLFAVEVITALPPQAEVLPDVEYDSIPEEPCLPPEQVPFHPTGDQPSYISKDDIMYFINATAEKIQMKETFMQIVNTEVTIIRDKYMDKLIQFKELVKDRPKHLFHILEDIAKLRISLQPNFSRIYDQLQEFGVLEHMYKEIAERAETQQIEFKKFQQICNINCGLNPYYVRKGISSILCDDMVSFKVKDLMEYITQTLEAYLNYFAKDMLEQTLRIDTYYGKKVADLKTKLRNAAVKHFGNTMYDMLSLQDDYIHFAEDLQHMDISEGLRSIEENSASINMLLIGLKRDVKKYGEYCRNCDTPQYLKHGVEDLHWHHDHHWHHDPHWHHDHHSHHDPHWHHDHHDPHWHHDHHDPDWHHDHHDPHWHAEEHYPHYPDSNEEHYEHYEIVNELIKLKLEELIDDINLNAELLFKDLDEKLNHLDLEKFFTENLLTIQEEIDYAITEERKALDNLKAMVPEFSILTVYIISEDSKHVVENLEKIKQIVNDHV